MGSYRSLFDFEQNDSSLLLQNDEAKISVGGTLFTGRCEIRLEFFPRVDIYVYGFFDMTDNKDGVKMGWHNASSFWVGEKKVEGFPLKVTYHENKIDVKWCIEKMPFLFKGSDSTTMDYIVFDLFNYIDFMGTKQTLIKSDEDSCFIQHINLRNDVWNIEIKSQTTTHSNFKILEKEGGYKATHVGIVRKNNGKSFTGDEAKTCMQALNMFLSFTKGCWCRPICPVGFDTSKDPVWIQLSHPSEPWQSPNTWFNPRNSSQIATFFPLFMKIYTDINWQDTLNKIIYWYMNSNHELRAIDNGRIILTQAAIELLAYEYCVNSRHLISSRSFKDKLPASDKFRLLFSSLNIPIDITKLTPKTKLLSKKTNWVDNIHALTEVRNCIVHPERKHNIITSDIIIEIWHLGLWYLEMGVLAICNYTGTYSNRFKGIHSDDLVVPWTN